MSSDILGVRKPCGSFYAKPLAEGWFSLANEMKNQSFHKMEAFLFAAMGGWDCHS